MKTLAVHEMTFKQIAWADYKEWSRKVRKQRKLALKRFRATGPNRVSMRDARTTIKRANAKEAQAFDVAHRKHWLRTGAVKGSGGLY